MRNADAPVDAQPGMEHAGTPPIAQSVAHTAAQPESTPQPGSAAPGAAPAFDFPVPVPPMPPMPGEGEAGQAPSYDAAPTPGNRENEDGAHHFDELEAAGIPPVPPKPIVGEGIEEAEGAKGRKADTSKKSDGNQGATGFTKLLPNILTIARIVMVPFILWFIVDGGTWTGWSALALFLVASFTDHLDGRIARKYNVISDFGKIADPIADKMLTLGVFITLSFIDYPPWWFTITVIARELAVTVLRMWLLRRSYVLPASKGGKFKTVTQMLLIVMLLAWPLLGVTDTNVTFAYSIAVNVVMVAAMVITVLTGLTYFLDAYDNAKAGPIHVSKPFPHREVVEPEYAILDEGDPYERPRVPVSPDAGPSVHAEAQPFHEEAPVIKPVGAQQPAAEETRPQEVPATDDSAQEHPDAQPPSLNVPRPRRAARRAMRKTAHLRAEQSDIEPVREFAPRRESRQANPQPPVETHIPHRQDDQ